MKMLRAWIVLDNDETPLCWGEPWRDGECLYDDTPDSFTAFLEKESAEEALSETRKYAKSQNLERFWHTKTWKIVEIESPYGKE